ncbi:MAG: GspH/FimT family pseudopilin [Gemmatimonadota bacterium]|nr:GspH/FimT family pseudopilin [Gemmatimonadota bacterium]
MQRPSYTGDAGFSVGEALFALAAGALLIAIAAPELGTVQRQRTLELATDRFVAAHTLARSSAMQHGRVAELRVDAEAGRFWVSIDTAGTGVPDTVGEVQTIEEGVRITSTVEVLCFDPEGGRVATGPCAADDASLDFESDGARRTVRVHRSGEVDR